MQTASEEQRLLHRTIIAAGLCLIFFTSWFTFWPAAHAWAETALRALPKMTLCVLAAVSAALIYSDASRRGIFLAAGAASLAVTLGLFHYAPAPSDSDGETAYRRGRLVRVIDNSPDTATELTVQAGRFVSIVLAGIFLGAWIGVQLRSGAQFVAMVLCVAAGDLWMNVFRVPDSIDPTHPLSLLRLPWPPSVGGPRESASLIYVLFISATLHGGLSLRFSWISLGTGLAAGIMSASFLALTPWPALVSLTMPVFGSAVLLATWPELRSTSRELRNALCISLLLLSCLLAISYLYARTHPNPDLPPDTWLYRNAM